MSGEPLRVLVPLDGSADAESIFPALEPLARFRQVRMTLFRVIGREESAESARTYLGSLLDRLGGGNLPSEIKCEWGNPAEEILWLGKEVRFDLIAMSTHGRTGLRRTFLGSVAEEVLRRAEVPLLINRPETRSGDWKEIVVGLDGSSLAESILPYALKLARTAGGRLHLIQAVMPAMMLGAGEEGVYFPTEDPLPYLRRVCGRLEKDGASAVPVAREGPPAAEICSLAEEVGAGLICVATHGRSGLGRVLMGSTAEEVLRRAPCPVFVRRTVRTVAGAGPAEVGAVVVSPSGAAG